MKYELCIMATVITLATQPVFGLGNKPHPLEGKAKTPLQELSLACLYGDSAMCEESLGQAKQAHQTACVPGAETSEACLAAKADLDFCTEAAQELLGTSVLNYQIVEEEEFNPFEKGSAELAASITAGEAGPGTATMGVALTGLDKPAPAPLPAPSKTLPYGTQPKS